MIRATGSIACPGAGPSRGAAGPGARLPGRIGGSRRPLGDAGDDRGRLAQQALELRQLLFETLDRRSDQQPRRDTAVGIEDRRRDPSGAPRSLESLFLATVGANASGAADLGWLGSFGDSDAAAPEGPR